jgi:hypothetical protein
MTISLTDPFTTPTPKHPFFEVMAADSKAYKEALGKIWSLAKKDLKSLSFF